MARRLIAVHHGSRRPRGEEGFTLIEGMIAMVMLAVGLLALAGLLDVALSRNVDANDLSQATHLASDMVERIRFNRANVSAYSGLDSANSTTRPPSTQPMAQGDYDQWSARLASSKLGGARGQVTVTALGPQGVNGLNQSQVAVTVSWSGVVLPHTLTLTTVVAPE